MQPLWAIVLAGGKGTRLSPLVQRIHADGRPKQFAVLMGSRSLLRQTLDRVALAVPPERTVVVTTETHAPFFAAEFSGPGAPRVGKVLVQSQDRGTAAGILLPAQWIAWRDPEATVADLPVGPLRRRRRRLHAPRGVPRGGRGTASGPHRPRGGHARLGGDRAMAGSSRASSSSARSPARSAPSTGSSRSLRPRRHAPASRGGGLWNTFVMVAKVSAILEAGRRALPDLMERLVRRSARSAESEGEARAIARPMPQAPTADFSQVGATPSVGPARRLPACPRSAGATGARPSASSRRCSTKASRRTGCGSSRRRPESGIVPGPMTDAAPRPTIPRTRRRTSSCARARPCACARSGARTPRRCSTSSGACPPTACTSASSASTARTRRRRRPPATSTTADRYGYVGEGGGPDRRRGALPARRLRSARAEVTFAVEEPLRGQGVGTRLLERLAEIARARGIGIFEARAPAPNPRMLDVFASCGFPMRRRRLPKANGSRSSLTPDARLRGEVRATAPSRRPRPRWRRLFEPRSVAVIGASRERGKIGAEILHNLVATGFRGPVFPVNPSAAEIEGVRCYAAPRRHPGPGRPRRHRRARRRGAEAAIDDCVAKGVEGVVVITAGFGETGEEGRRREAALLEKVRDAGMRMVGPNCMGLVNTDPAVRLNATFAPTYPPAGRVALPRRAARSASRCSTTPRALNLGISTFVSVGNKADVSGNDLLQYWAEDPRTDVILLYLESFGNPGRLLPHRAPRRAEEADRRRQGRPLARGRARRLVPHGRARRERHGRGRALPPGRRDPHRHARGALRRRGAARAPAGARAAGASRS